MVCRLDPRDCACGICDGGQVAPEGYFGGSWCPCECHALKGDERDKFIEKRRIEQQAAADKLVENAFKNKTHDKEQKSRGLSLDAIDTIQANLIANFNHVGLTAKGIDALCNLARDAIRAEAPSAREESEARMLAKIKEVWNELTAGRITKEEQMYLVNLAMIHHFTSDDKSQYVGCPSKEAK